MANYLYNGVELPDIEPRWELVGGKNERPYATIYRAENAIGEIVTTLCFSSLPFVYDGLEMSTGYGYYDTDALLSSGGPWWGGGLGDRFGTRKINPDDYIWSSYDILNEDGTVYLATSSPIPVNPAPTLDPTALLMCWQVGNRIRGGA